LIVLAEFKPPVYEKQGIRLVTSGIRRPGADVLDAKIHHNNLINSILAKIQANAAGVDDALMLDSRGFVAETNATHAFIVAGGRVLTPFCHACPEGITRGAVLDLCRANQIPCAECDLGLAEVYRAEEMFCTGTMGELAPVIEVDGRSIGVRKAGPTTVRLMRLFTDLTATEGDRVVAG
jgi:branched-chain amino acid aminotransferase